MTGDITSTSGDAHITGLNLATDMKEARTRMGYCP